MTAPARPLPIHTARLRLIPCTAAVARAADAGGAAAVSSWLGVVVDPSWPSADLREVLPGYADALERDPGLLGWGVWLILDGRGANLVGDVGFKGPPDSAGEIEIGYGVVVPHRRRGLATEAAAALIEWAWRQPGVQRITARCFEFNEASIAVLRRLGFHLRGSEEGILEWELERPEDLSS